MTKATKSNNIAVSAIDAYSPGVVFWDRWEPSDRTICFVMFQLSSNASITEVTFTVSLWGTLMISFKVSFKTSITCGKVLFATTTEWAGATKGLNMGVEEIPVDSKIYSAKTEVTQVSVHAPSVLM